MKRLGKPILPISAFSVVVLTVFLTNCKFSFAESRRAERGSINFGAAKPPQVKTPPQLESFKTVFADVAEGVIPTVVSITSTKIDTVMYRDPFSQFFWGSPFEDFFGSPRRQQPQQRRRRPESQQRIIPRSGFGSGVIVSEEGHILTNYHVVSEADEIAIETADERRFEAEIVGVDSLSDVAVVKITEKVEDLPVAYLGNSDSLRPGDWVMAVGNPFNLSSTVTTGIVSALGRSTGAGATYQDFIQTDAAINPGNSGGALVDIEGELVGINTMIYTRSGGYMGIGFAIPINMARRIMKDLIYEGRVSRGWLGVSIQDLDEDMREAMGIEDRRGVLIGDVFKGQPADKGGIKRGDIVVSINGNDVADVNDLRNEVADIRPGSKVPVTLIRDGKKATVTVKIAERTGDAKDAPASDDKAEEESGEPDVAEKLGMKIGSLSKQLREQLDLDADTKGVVVLGVEPGSQAAREGIKQHDVIREVNRKKISSAKDFKRAMRSVKPGGSVLFLLQRDGRTFFVAFKVRE